MNPKQILHHRYISGLSIELIEPTSRGWKVLETQVFANSRKRPKVKTAYYTKYDLRDMFNA